jgi:hypothetical protein
MPYNSFMQNTYNPYVQYQQMLQPQPQQQQNNGLTWVQGIEGAKSHFVSPGQSALLMDSESNSFFIKTADASGMPLPLRVFDYKERTAQQAPQQPTVAVTDTSGYITREEFEARIAEITATTERTDINAE